MKKSKNYFPELATTLSAISVVGRLVPHPANVTPIGGTAIWAGTRLKPWQSLMIVLGTMFVTDIFLGFHGRMPLVYGCLALTTLAAHYLKPKTPGQIGAFTLTSAIVFFLVTNTVFYPAGGITLYPATWAGQLASYTAALPFFRNSLIGDAAYTAAFFGLEAAIRYLAAHQQLKERSVYGS